MSFSQTLRVAVVGAGAFGRNHLRVYRELERAGLAVELAGVVDRDPATLSVEEAERFGRLIRPILAETNRGRLAA